MEALQVEWADASTRLASLAGRVAKERGLAAKLDPPERGNGTGGQWYIHHGRAVKKVGG